jgi:hypothetical protein
VLWFSMPEDVFYRGAPIHGPTMNSRVCYRLEHRAILELQQLARSTSCFCFGPAALRHGRLTETRTKVIISGSSTTMLRKEAPKCALYCANLVIYSQLMILMTL